MCKEVAQNGLCVRGFDDDDKGWTDEYEEFFDNWIEKATLEVDLDDLYDAVSTNKSGRNFWSKNIFRDWRISSTRTL